MMNLIIRKAGVDDFASIYALIKEFSEFIKTPEKVSITVEQMINEKDYFHCFVAEFENRILGFATYFTAFYSWSGKAIYLDDLYVIPDYRGKGIGHKLFSEIIRTAKTLQCKKVKWQVSNWNAKAIEFYKKLGAEIDTIEINCDLKL